MAIKQEWLQIKYIMSTEALMAKEKEKEKPKNCHWVSNSILETLGLRKWYTKANKSMQIKLRKEVGEVYAPL